LPGEWTSIDEVAIFIAAFHKELRREFSFLMSCPWLSEVVKLFPVTRSLIQFSIALTGEGFMKITSIYATEPFYFNINSSRLLA
jgi:hypothetical protein